MQMPTPGHEAKSLKNGTPTLLHMKASTKNKTTKTRVQLPLDAFCMRQTSCSAGYWPLLYSLAAPTITKGTVAGSKKGTMFPILNKTRQSTQKIL